MLLEAVFEPHPLAPEPVELAESAGVEDLGVRSDECERERRHRIERDWDDLRPDDTGLGFARTLLGVVGVGKAREDVVTDAVALEKRLVEPVRRDAEVAGQLLAGPEGDDADLGETPHQDEELVFTERVRAGQSRWPASASRNVVGSVISRSASNCCHVTDASRSPRWPTNS